MAAVRKTEGGFEMTRQFITLAVSAAALVGTLVGLTAAGVRASNQIASAASREALTDSVRALRLTDSLHKRADSIHEARQDSVILTYSRQTHGLLCKQYGNPEAFCGSTQQAGRSR